MIGILLFIQLITSKFLNWGLQSAMPMTTSFVSSAMPSHYKRDSIALLSHYNYHNKASEYIDLVLPKSIHLSLAGQPNLATIMTRLRA